MFHIFSLRTMRTKVGVETSSSPAAYLLGLKKHLTPRDTIRVARAMFKRQKLLT